jgi:hypothetical protein
MPSSLKEFVKMRSTRLQDQMRAAMEEQESERRREVVQTQIDRSQNYDIDGVSMDQRGVEVATDEIPREEIIKEDIPKI